MGVSGTDRLPDGGFGSDVASGIPESLGVVSGTVSGIRSVSVFGPAMPLDPPLSPRLWPAVPRGAAFPRVAAFLRGGIIGIRHVEIGDMWMKGGK